MIEVYRIDDDGGFQVDCDAGSFVFRPSRFGAGRIEFVNCEPPEARPMANVALLAAIAACI